MCVGLFILSNLTLSKRESGCDICAAESSRTNSKALIQDTHLHQAGKNKKKITALWAYKKALFYKK